MRSAPGRTRPQPAEADERQQRRCRDTSPRIVTTSAAQPIVFSGVKANIETASALVTAVSAAEARTRWTYLSLVSSGGPERPSTPRTTARSARRRRPRSPRRRADVWMWCCPPGSRRSSGAQAHASTVRALAPPVAASSAHTTPATSVGPTELDTRSSLRSARWETQQEAAIGFVALRGSLDLEVRLRGRPSSSRNSQHRR
jgi:hypothetical protein